MAADVPAEPLDGSPGPDKDAGVERLLALLWLFRLPGTVRSDAEIEECGYPDVHGEDSVGRKNFANDRHRLAGLGVELEHVPERDGWRVADSSDPTALQFTPQERQALLEAEILLAGDATAAVRRPALRVPAVVPVLLDACGHRHPVRFSYKGRPRTVRPAKVSVSENATWYLQALDEADGLDKVFRVDRIAGPVDVDRERTVPTPRTRPPRHPTAWDVDGPVDAVVVFDHEPKPEWLAMLGPCTPDPDRPRTWHFRPTYHDAFVARVLAVGPDARLTGPPALVERLHDALRAHRTAPGLG